MTEQINSLPKGTMLRGGDYDYRIERVLGSGSFGITYLASYQDKSGLSIYVAVKEFFMNDINGREGSSVTTGSKDGLFGDYRRKFAREAKNLKKLDHPNIIKVMEYFECNNTSYYTMEYLEGGSLDDYIKQHGALSEKQTIIFANQIGEALSYMHSHKMLHLDLKPKNIMLRSDGSPVLIDFGLAKQYDTSGNPESSTKVGGGTPGYAPIEQSDYRDGNGFPVTMDVYALGATMYKMLTAQTPPLASEILNNGLSSSTLRSFNISQTTVNVVIKSMSPAKRNRYNSVGEMMNSISQYHSEQGTQIDKPVEKKTNWKNAIMAFIFESIFLGIMVSVSLGFDSDSDGVIMSYFFSFIALFAFVILLSFRKKYSHKRWIAFRILFVLINIASSIIMSICNPANSVPWLLLSIETSIISAYTFAVDTEQR